MLEHGLLNDGMPDPKSDKESDPESFEAFFSQTGSGKYVPRSIFVDLDPSVCEDVSLEFCVMALMLVSQSMRSALGQAVTFSTQST